jgi:hypothetical protein
MTSLLPILISAIAIATVLNVILKRFNTPIVVGYIFTGVTIGSLFDIDVHGNESLGHIAEFGVVFLIFTIGLERRRHESSLQDRDHLVLDRRALPSDFLVAAFPRDARLRIRSDRPCFHRRFHDFHTVPDHQPGQDLWAHI